MKCMFSGYSSLNELKLSNFNTDKVICMKYMLYECPFDLQHKIISKNKKIRNEATTDFD